MAQTKLADLINPQVMADMIDTKLHDLIRFSPLAEVDETLAGQPGNTISLPSYAYIGDAETLAEGEALVPVKLTATSTPVTIHKVARGVEVTDEAILSGYGDPFGQAAYQVASAIANGVDNEMLTTLTGIAAGMTHTGATIADINPALELFGEDIDVGEKAIVVPPALYTAIRNTKEWLPASEIAAARMIRGAVGEVFGCQIIVSNKLNTSGNAFIVKPGALRLFLKRDTLVEYDRNILNYTNLITGSKHFATYLYDASKAIKLAAA